MLKIPRKISLYIIKIFLVRLLLLCLFIGLLVFITNIMETLKNSQDKDVSGFIIFQIVLYQIPQWIEVVMPFLIMIASILTFNKLSNSSEMSIVRSGGISAWQFLSPVIISSFALGLLTMLAFNPLTTSLNLKSNALNSKYVEKEEETLLIPDKGAWFRQEDLETGGEIIFRAKKIYKDDLAFEDVILNYLNADKLPTKRIEAKKMILKKEGFWELKNVKIMEEGKRIEEKKEMTIQTTLKHNFIDATITNKYEKVESINFWELPSKIKIMQESGLPSTKFRVYFNSLLMEPFLFVAIVLISSFFSLTHVRSNKNAIMVTLGIVSGFFIYFTSDVMLEFGKIGKVPVFVSTWLVSLIYMAIGVALVVYKEE